jgi:hypothetical protein
MGLCGTQTKRNYVDPMQRLAIFLLTIFALTACGNDESAWDMAQRDDSPTGYLEFLAKFPKSTHAAEARTRMEDLKEIKAWERAEFRGNEAGFNSFIEKYPDSEHIALAHERIEALQRDAEWAIAQDADSIEVVTAFLRRYPEAPQAGEAQELLTTLEKIQAAERPAERAGNYRLQLAAFKTARSADNEVRRLVALLPETLMGPVRIETPIDGDVNPMFVLKSVPMTWVEAQTACETLRKNRQTCLVINR